MDSFVITDGNRFMYENAQGKYIPAHTLDMADTFTRDKANIVLNTYIPKSLRKNYRVEKIHIEEESPKTEDIYKRIIAPVTKQDIESNRIKVSELEKVSSLLTKLNDVNKSLEYLSVRKAELSSELSKVDREISDWMHYIEFKSFNACQGYIAAKSLSECRKRRRMIKDEFIVLKEISSTVCNIDMSKIDNIIKSMDHRCYKPKENKEIFSI